MTQAARLPETEADRLAALRRLEVLDSATEPGFDALVKAAALVCGTPISLISLVDADRQWFKANVGLPGTSETPRELAFCAHALLDKELMEVADATQDKRFAQNPLVTGSPDIRFYAGMPLELSDGHRIGTLCVIDRVPRLLTESQREVLRCLGRAAATALEMRRSVVQEAQASAVLQGSLDAVIGLDENACVKLWNPAAVALFGFSASERLGRELVDLEPPHRRGEVRRHWREVMTTRNSLRYETTRLHRDGSEIAISVNLTPVFNASGHFVGATKVLHDLRAQKQQEQALRASESRHRVLNDMSPLGVFGADAKGARTYTNARWQEIYGLPAMRALGDGWTDALHPDDRQQVLEHWQRCVGLQTEFKLEFRVQHSDGAVRTVRSRARPVLDDLRRTQSYVGAVEDITESVALLERLSSSEAHVRRLYESTPALLHSIDSDCRVLTVSDRWLKALGYARAEVVGQPFTDFLSEASRQTAERVGLPSLHAEGRVSRLPLQVITKAGQLRDVELSALLECDAQGQPLRTMAVMEEVTERLRAERQLRRSQELLDQTNRLAGVGGWEVDLLTQRLAWSDQTCRIHGVAPGYVPDLADAISFYAPEARCVVEAAVARAASDGTPWDFELPLTRADGEPIWVRATGCAEFHSGRAVRLYGAFQDITERVASRKALELAHERITLATQSGGIGVWEYKLESGELSWDARMFELYGLDPSQGTSYSSWLNSLHPEDRPLCEARFAEALAGGQSFEMGFRIRLADGRERHLRGAARVSHDQYGTAQRMTGVSWDVTESMQLQQELQEQTELLEVTLESIGDAVITTNAQGEITWLNPVAERMTGWTSAQARGRALSQVFHIVNQETRLPTENPVATCLQQGKVVGMANHTLLLSRDGTEHGIEDSAAPIRNARGEVLGVVLVFHDVTEQRRLSGEMNYRATHDDLTGLLNRAEFESRLNRVLKQAHEDHSVHALLYIDLDQFKLVNDACGHSAGDQLLQQVAKLLGDTVRSRDTLARLGGDEFAAILEHCTDQQALTVAQKICERMEVFRFEHDAKRFRVGTSIGLVPVDARWNGTAAILQAADSSCYAAKEAGRNRVQVWLDTDHALRTRHGEMQWTTRIEQALDEDRFELFAQRIVPLGDAEPGLHAEVLLRMRDTDGSLIAPGAFLPAAERFHLATRVDRWVLKAVLSWLQSHAEQVHCLSMNLSGQSLGDRAFHRQAVEQLSLLPSATLTRLCFEITETAAITNLADAALFIEQVRALGVQVALDDFGAGMSSFGYLKSLPVTTLKIDGQFVKKLLSDALDHAAVRSFVEVARLVNMKTVAEFVETQAVHDELRRLGVSHAQGYLLHRPEPLLTLLQPHGSARSTDPSEARSGDLFSAS